MAFRQNYGQQRADRDRAKRTKKAEKLKQLEERAARRKAEREKSGARVERAD
jgi:hypothetical protein